jgi:hypothetical protein
LGFLGSAGMGGNLVDAKSQFFHYKLPLLGGCSGRTSTAPMSGTRGGKPRS